MATLDCVNQDEPNKDLIIKLTNEEKIVLIDILDQLETSWFATPKGDKDRIEEMAERCEERDSLIASIKEKISNDIPKTR